MTQNTALVKQRINSYYKLWKHNKDKYNHLPSYVDNKYGVWVRSLSSNMESQDGGLLSDLHSAGARSLIQDNNSMLSVASKLMAGNNKHELHVQLDEMLQHKQDPPYVPQNSATKYKGLNYGPGIDWSRYKVT